VRWPHITRDYALITEPARAPDPRQVAVDIAGMADGEAAGVNSLFQSVLTSLQYYNPAAKRGELAKYTPDRLREWVTIDGESVLVAKVAGRIAGFCFSNNDDQIVWLAWLGVHPGFRRMGVGASLLERLDMRAQKLTSHKIWCDSRTDNQASAALLRAQGYSQICTLKRHWYRQDFFIWEKYVD
jgi:ribosomal protein S18 acetylase RimI-like enzyme